MHGDRVHLGRAVPPVSQAHPTQRPVPLVADLPPLDAGRGDLLEHPPTLDAEAAGGPREAVCARCGHRIVRTPSGGWGTPDRVPRGCYHRPVKS
jgi:hypothetical protein